VALEIDGRDRESVTVWTHRPLGEWDGGAPRPLQRLRHVPDEHITMPISVGISRWKHSAQLDLHVKHVLISVWSARGLRAGRRGEPTAEERVAVPLEVLG
jgi:hypothetical protein